MGRQTEVVMQVAGSVLLHDKDPLAALPRATYRLGSRGELLPSVIIREHHVRHSPSPSQRSGDSIFAV